MSREKQKILHEVVPVPCFFTAHFCAGLVRLCADMSVLRQVFGPRSDDSLSSFEFVTKMVEALATAHLVSCVDALSYRIACVQRSRALEASIAARRDSSRAALMERSKSIIALSDASASVTSGAADSSSEAMAAVETMAQRRAKLAAVAEWEDSLREAFEASEGKCTDGELQYFESLALLEYCLLVTFLRVDAAARARITWAEFASFLADCTDAAPPVGVSDQSALEMLLPAVEQRCKSLDTAMIVSDWAGRHCLAALCEENYAQTVSVVDLNTLQDQKVHKIPENVGKILGVQVLPRHNAIVLVTYSGLRVHDADNFLCKGASIEKTLVSCVAWVDDVHMLLAGNQSGHVMAYDLAGMDRHFFSTNKPYSLPIASKRRAHSEMVTSILPRCVASHFVVTGSMDGTVCMHHFDNGSTRVFTGPSVLGLSLAEHLGLILCYGLDTVPFAYSFNVPGSRHISLGNSSTRGHPKRIIYFGPTDDDDYAVSIDRTGVAKVWCLPTNTCVQTISCTEDLDGTAGFMMFHAVAPVNKDWVVIGRRRAFRFAFNDAHFGRVPARASQKPLSAVALDEATRVVIMASGLELTVWDTVLGRLRAHTVVEFLPPPPGAPHGSVVDRVSALHFTPDKRSLVVCSEKYCLNVHCAATLVHRSRHVFPLSSGCLLRANPVSMPEDVMCDTSCVILSFANDNPKLLMHREAWSAVTGGGADAATALMMGRVNEASRDPTRCVSSGSHTVDRLVLSSASDALRARLAVVHVGTDTLITSEITGWEGPGATTPTTLAVWARLLNGSWGRSDSFDITDDAGIVSIDVPPNPKATHFVVLLSTGRIAVCVIDVPNASLRRVTCIATFAHRRGGMAHLLDAVVPSAVAFHPVHSRVLVVGDDAGTLCWYDVGDALHTDVDEDSGECPACHELLDDRSRGPPCAWLTVKTASYAEHVSGVTFVPLPRVGWATLATYGDGEAIYWRCKGDGDDGALRSIPFIDTSKRIIREHRARTQHYAYEGFLRHATPTTASTSPAASPKLNSAVAFSPTHAASDAAFYGLPALVVGSGRCGTEGFGARFNRCSDIITHASVDSIKPMSKRFPTTAAVDSPQPNHHRPQSTTVSDSKTGTAGFSAATPSAMSGAGVFITGLNGAEPPPTALLPTAAAEPELVDDELPPPRSIRGLGLTQEQTVSMYKEWVFGQQIKLQGADRVERLKILHAIHDSTASAVVDKLLETDDGFYEEAKAKRSPRSFHAVESDRNPSERPSKATLLQLARPSGVVRQNVTDALSVDARLLSLPPRTREHQVEVDRLEQQMKARFDFNQRENRTKEEKLAAKATLQEMPHAEFKQLLRDETKRAASEELSVKLAAAAAMTRLSPVRRAGDTSPLESPTQPLQQQRRRDDAPYPVEDIEEGRTRRRPPVPLATIRHARAAGGRRLATKGPNAPTAVTSYALAAEWHFVVAY